MHQSISDDLSNLSWPVFRKFPVIFCRKKGWDVFRVRWSFSFDLLLVSDFAIIDNQNHCTRENCQNWITQKSPLYFGDCHFYTVFPIIITMI